MIHQLTNKQDIEDLKSYINTNGYKSPSILFNNTGATIQFDPKETFQINIKTFTLNERKEIKEWLQSLTETPKPQIDEQQALIFGKDETSHVVSIEPRDGYVEIFREKDGHHITEKINNKFWILCSRQLNNNWEPLKGNLHYKYIKWYNNKNDFFEDRRKYKDCDIYSMSDAKEATMLSTGITYFKGMKVDDVSRFHFDLETIGLLEAPKHRTLLISTTFVSNGQTKKKLFSCDEYPTDGAMLVDFCRYLRACNPSIVTGFNIFGFDFPYLQKCADNEDIKLELGRDSSPLRFNKYVSQFRKDGSQDYEYTRCFIYGREIVDMMFVAYHFDFARKYERYALKSIIKQEGLEKPGRQFYDAATIHKNWDNLEERKKIKEYCIDDSDDSESLYKLMIPAYFYSTPSVPKSFQSINYSATGSQVNSFLVRSYLQHGFSVPKPSEVQKFEGAISDGYPGIYSNVFKVDVASLYPSIMLQYEIFDEIKDPQRNFFKMVEYFTKERLEDKKKAKETGDRYYKELEQSKKIFINSAYGLLGANGLNFNSPTNASLVTEKGREILKKAVLWATGKDYVPSDTVQEEIS